MNIVIENQNSSLINEINIDTVKRLSGVYDISQIFQEVSSLQYDKVILDITALNNVGNIDTFKSLISFIKPENIILVVANVNINPTYLQNLIDLGIYNYAYTSDHIVSLYDSPNVYEDAIVLISGNKAKIVGIKNVTKHAGATTLTYMLKTHLKKQKKKVVAFEIEKMDFNYFYDKELISVVENKLEFTLEKYYNINDIVLIDLNDSKKAMDMCDVILYLVEPSMIKINQLMLINPTVFKNLRGSKVILNQSNLNNNELKEFESESYIKVYYNIPSLNERKNNEYINGLIKKLGL